MHFFIGNNSCKFLMGYMFNGYWFVFFVGLEYLARKNILYMYLFDLSLLVYSFKKQQLEIAQMCMLPSFKCQQKYFKML